MTLAAVSFLHFFLQKPVVLKEFVEFQREHGESQVALLNLTDLQDGQEFPSQLGWNIVILVLMVALAGFGFF